MIFLVGRFPSTWGGLPVCPGTYTFFQEAVRSKQNVCELGMGSALSSLVFLQYSDATVYEYDLGDEKKLAVAAFMHSLFGKDRLRLRWGDISTTVPNNAPKCDLVYLDAMHPLDVVLSVQYLSTETIEWLYHSGGSGDVKARQFFLRVWK